MLLNQPTSIEQERQIRERRLFWIALCTSIITAIIGIGSLWAVIRNGNQQTENAKRLLAVQLAREF